MGQGWGELPRGSDDTTVLDTGREVFRVGGTACTNLEGARNTARSEVPVAGTRSVGGGVKR